MGWGSLRFDPKQVSATSGTVAFFLQMDPNGSLTGHNMAIGPKLYQMMTRSEIIQPKRSAVFTVEGLEPGSYTFWCEVSGHAKEGMVGLLTITP
jgi:plastocyanin